MDKQIIIDGVDIKDCKRRIGKDNYCRYYKRPCAENNYNCIWKKYLRKEQECEELKTTLAEIKEIAEGMHDLWINKTKYTDIDNLVKHLLECELNRIRYKLDEISECEIGNDN